MICPICSQESKILFCKLLKSSVKFDLREFPSISGIVYNGCSNCGCCFTLDEFIPDTSNQGDVERNNNNINKVRLERINWYGPEKIETVVDFGCGNRQFYDFASQFYDEVLGIDYCTGVQLEHVQTNSTDVINCVEVIEHLIEPHGVVEEFYRILKKDGIVYLESSFVDNLGDLQKSGYVDPNIGHVLIHSKKSIEMLFEKFEVKWLNDNVCIFKKK